MGRSSLFLTLVFFFTGTFLATSQPTMCTDKEAFRKQAEAGFHVLYKNDMKGAFARVKSLKAECPNNPSTHLFEATYWWWQLISGSETEENYAKMEASLEAALNKLPPAKKAESYTNEQLYNVILIYAYKSRIKMFQGKYIKGIQSMNSCVDFIKMSFGKENEDDFFKLTSGLYNYFVAHGYESSFWARAYLIFLPDGDKQKGLEFLKSAAKSKDFIVRTEAQYFLMKIYAEAENQPKVALGYTEQLVNAYPDNLLYRYYLHKLMLKLNMGDKAAVHLTALQQAAKSGESNAAHFLKLAEEDYRTFYAKKE